MNQHDQTINNALDEIYAIIKTYLDGDVSSAEEFMTMEDNLKCYYLKIPDDIRDKVRNFTNSIYGLVYDENLPATLQDCYNVEIIEKVHNAFNSFAENVLQQKI